MAAWGLVAAALALHVVLGLAVDGTRLLPGDAAAFDVVEELRFAVGVDVVRVTTDAGSLPVASVLVGATAAYVAGRGRRDQALGLVAGLALLVVAVHYTKLLWDRPRPLDALSDARGLAYPSGHSAYATAYLACAFTTRSRVLLAVAAAAVLAIGLSRLYLHVHFFTDVVGGVALGVAAFAMFLRR